MLYTWEEAQSKIKSQNVFLTFTTSWCPDCKMMASLLAPLLQELQQIVDFEVIEIDAEAAQMFRTQAGWQVLKVPSFYLIKEGKQQHLGYEFVPLDFIKAKIIAYFGKR